MIYVNISVYSILLLLLHILKPHPLLIVIDIVATMAFITWTLVWQEDDFYQDRWILDFCLTIFWSVLISWFIFMFLWFLLVQWCVFQWSWNDPHWACSWLGYWYLMLSIIATIPVVIYYSVILSNKRKSIHLKS